MISIDLIDKFATIWRDIGQPKTDGLYIVASFGTQLAEMDSVIGIPVLVASSVISSNGLSVIIAGDNDISLAFDRRAVEVLL